MLGKWGADILSSELTDGLVLVTVNHQQAGLVNDQKLCIKSVFFLTRKTKTLINHFPVYM